MDPYGDQSHERCTTFSRHSNVSSKPKYIYRAKVISVYDGDTIRADIDLGLYMHSMNRSIRIEGIDTPEIRGKQKEAGRVVRDYVKKLFADNNNEIVITTQKPDKYGRVLAKVNVGGIDLIKHLTQTKKYAKAYDGGTKEKWTKKELDAILL